MHSYHNHQCSGLLVRSLHFLVGCLLAGVSGASGGTLVGLSVVLSPVGVSASGGVAYYCSCVLVCLGLIGLCDLVCLGLCVLI